MNKYQNLSYLMQYEELCFESKVFLFYVVQYSCQFTNLTPDGRMTVFVNFEHDARIRGNFHMGSMSRQDSTSSIIFKLYYFLI